MIVEIEMRGICLRVEVELKTKDKEFAIGRVFIEDTDCYDLLEEHMDEIEKLVTEQLNIE